MNAILRPLLIPNSILFPSIVSFQNKYFDRILSLCKHYDCVKILIQCFSFSRYSQELELIISTTMILKVSKSILNSHASQHTCRLQTRSTNQKPINVFLLCKVLAILIRHRAAINNPGVLRGFGRYRRGKPFPNRLMNLLGLLCGCDFASANCPSQYIKSGSPRLELSRSQFRLPDRFICDDDIRPIFRSVCNSVELTCYDFDGFLGFALLVLVNLKKASVKYH